MSRGGTATLVPEPSPGKRLLGIHVVDRDGNALTPSRAAPRALLVATPFVLNWFFYSPGSVPGMVIGAALWWVGLPGLMLAGLYLVVFNRRTRQGLHDWLTGALVIRRGVSPAPHDTVWRPHLVVASGLLLLSAALPLLVYGLMNQISHDFAPLDNMLSAQTQIQSHPGVSRVSVQHLDYWDGPRVLEIGVLIDTDPDAQQELASRLASQARRAIPAAAGDPVAVTLARGWSLGLTSSYTNQRYVFE
ncbi:MAG: RDD family protein [Spiribacter salinus]|uniref:RDD family protein n=1 Tax=Spiribacter salinus TaxID=1335746 RepID=A0A540V883_9GAMM|nr:MAG: RDD family protein [Spiribacter salinus]